MLMFSMMERPHWLCTEIASRRPHLAPADGLFDGLGRTSCTARLRNIILWDSTFQFLQGDLIVFSPEATFYSHLAVSCQLYWISPHVLQPTAHSAPAPTSFPFPGVLECSPERALPWALPFHLCRILISAFYRDVVLSDTFLSFNLKGLRLIAHLGTFSSQKINLWFFSKD